MRGGVKREYLLFFSALFVLFILTYLEKMKKMTQFSLKLHLMNSVLS